ncbi:hypothetical protein J6590_021050 [Homalodisca vitripennis]|nr:hypothetical protein J6590_021050 [Homalodisca vitripennis]
MIKKRSRSLELSALHPQQQPGLSSKQRGRDSAIRNRDKQYNSQFNYQNVLPLFNVQDTIRPTTYRPQLLNRPTTVDPRSLEGVDHRFSQKQTNGYLPLQQNQQQQNHRIQHLRHFNTPAVQIVPSISLNDDNGLIGQHQFELGPLNQQYFLDPTLYNQQLQYQQFQNGQAPFLIQVQDQFPSYQRPIRKESDRPTGRALQGEIQRKQRQQQLSSKERNIIKQQNKIQQNAPKPVQPLVNQPEAFQIPILPQGADISVSSAILAEQFEQTSVDSQPQPRQAVIPSPPDFLTVPPQFVNNGFFSTDFGPSTPIRPPPPTRPPSRLRSFGSSQNVLSRPLQSNSAVSDNPSGSFSRFVLNSQSGTHDTLVRY